MFEVSKEAADQARALGMFGDVSDRLIRMARESAPFTHPSGNRRYESFLLTIDDKKIISIRRMQQADTVGEVMPQRMRNVPTSKRRPVVEVPMRQKVYTSAMDCPLCHGTMTAMAYEECEFCAGVGCTKCKGEGQIGRYIPCHAAQNGESICRN